MWSLPPAFNSKEAYCLAETALPLSHFLILVHSPSQAVPSCSDGKKNQDERDVDCGGAKCGKCTDGKACMSNADCTSAKCVQKKCQVCRTVMSCSQHLTTRLSIPNTSPSTA